jgi:hypothetical protein
MNATPVNNLLISISSYLTRVRRITVKYLRLFGHFCAQALRRKTTVEQTTAKCI